MVQPMELDTQKDKPQQHQRGVDKPHERADVEAGKQRCQHDGQTRRAAERKVVGRFETRQCPRPWR